MAMQEEQQFLNHKAYLKTITPPVYTSRVSKPPMLASVLSIAICFPINPVLEKRRLMIKPNPHDKSDYSLWC